jgi:hypothetical protein
MAEFMLLIRNGNWDQYSPEEAQQAVQKYIAWARKLREEGRLKGGDELQANGRILRKQAGQIVDGPFAETKESVGGYFLIEADNYDHAVAIARECPTFDHGGWVEIRAISLYQ